MPVTFDNVGGTSTTGPALNFTFTAAAGSTLLFAACAVGGAVSVSACAYNNVPLTRLGRTTTLELWALTAPAAGANDLSVTFATGASFWAVGALTYVNTRSAVPFGDAAVSATAGAVTNFDLTASATSEQLVVGFMRAQTATEITINNGTTRLDLLRSSGGVNVRLLAADIAGAGPSVVISASATGGTVATWLGIAVPIYFSAGSAVRYMKALTGVGY